MKFRKLYTEKGVGDEGRFRSMTPEEKRGSAAIPTGARPFVAENLNSAGRTESCVFDVEYEGQVFRPTRGKSWKTNFTGMETLARSNRLFPSGNNLYYLLLHEDYPVQELSNVWNDTRGEIDKSYAVQTTTTVIQRCLLMTTDPGDLVFDPTCVRKGTRVWCVRDGGSPPIVPPHAGGRSLPVYGEGRGGAGRGRAGRGEANQEGTTPPPEDGGSPPIVPPHAGGHSLPVYGLALPISAWGIAEHAMHELPGCRDISKAAKP
jgi:hypothetical protein